MKSSVDLIEIIPASRGPFKIIISKNVVAVFEGVGISVRFVLDRLKRVKVQEQIRHSRVC